MIARFNEAIRILARHFGLFASLVLTVWLPGNLLINYMSYHVIDAGEMDYLRVTLWIESIFGPLYIGALVFALYKIKSGHAVTYKEAIGVGLKNWGSLFAARFVAGLLTILGLIAFIIPGLALAVRYSMLDEALVLEGKGVSQSRERSTELSAGRRWQIFWSAFLFFIPFAIFSFLIYLPLTYFESLDHMVTGVILDCILDLVYAVIQIVIFLFYWETTHAERDGKSATPGEINL